MAHRLTGAAVVGQSGGPTAVINASLAGCVAGLRRAGGLERILGVRHGVRGIVADEYVDLTTIPEETLERVAVTPSAALGSCRDKPDEEYCERILEGFKRNNVRTFFYIGGNDSSDTCRSVHELARRSGYPLASFHIPKTIDNDLVHNDHTPGFGSAARFVALAMMGDDLDNRSLPGIKVNIVMGRHAGFLTAASLLARCGAGGGPHLIYVPEDPFDEDAFAADVERVYREQGRCLIAVSEGIHHADGTPIAARLARRAERDAHGNVQLSGSGALGDHLAEHLKEKLGGGIRVRADTYGYLQRSFVGCVSEVDRAEARAVGAEAAAAAAAGAGQGSITIRRVESRPYRVGFERVPLEEVAAKTRTLPQEFRLGAGRIAESYLEYAAPLAGELPRTATL